jgi:peptidoglycan/xylan/chitin deacetylase (PgdA/CDA1 family)
LATGSTLKALLRRTLAETFHYSGITALLHRRARGTLVIPCYHRVLPSAVREASPMPVLAVTPEAFTEHLAFFASAYECLPLAEAIDRLESRAPGPRPLLSVTFDDGYADNHTHALPLLRAHGIRATFFVITSLVDTDRAPWYDRLARAEQFVGESVAVGSTVEHAKFQVPDARAALIEEVTTRAARDGWREPNDDRIMSAAQLRELHAEGHEIAAHTRTHPILPLLDADQLAAELVGAREDLRDLVGIDAVSFAYPNGTYDQKVVAAVRHAGYRYAVTTQPGRNPPGGDPHTLCRQFIGQEPYTGSSGKFAPHVMALRFAGAG